VCSSDLLQVHDELLFEVEQGAEDTLIAAAREVMENANDPVVKLDVKLTVDAGTGANWAEAHGRTCSRSFVNVGVSGFEDACSKTHLSGLERMARAARAKTPGWT